MSRDTPIEDARRALTRIFGFESFRAHQQEIIAATLAGRDVFAALPTGGGKSLCYQLPAVVADGLTLVVSPLIALMQDQVDAARDTGVDAACLNSTIDAETAHETWRDLAQHRIDLLYASPERLASEEFRARLGEWGLARIAIDEAHCISEWGHEFRPEYRSLAVLRREYPDVPVAAFTATATREVQADVIGQLELRDPLVVRASFDRPEITYRVERRANAVVQLLDFLERHPGEPGIVYRGTRAGTEETAAALVERGISAAAYHAGLSGEERTVRQQQFVRDELQVIVATIAFGMGIDKSNVRWIVHDDLPRSLEGYYQETGRAGRDGEAAEVLLLWGPKDIVQRRWFIGRIASDDERERARRQLQEVLGWVEAGECRRRRLLAHFDEEHPGSCDNCDVCLGEVALADVTVAAQKLMSAMARTGEVFGAHHIVDILLGEETDKVRERGHERLPTFGVGTEFDRRGWLDLVRELDSGGYIERRTIEGSSRPGGYRITGEGRAVLAGRRTVVSAAAGADAAVGGGASGAGHRPVHGGAAAVGGGGASGAGGDTARGGGAGRRRRVAETDGGVPGASASPAPLRPGEEQLFECLRAWRLRTARERRLPPYVILSDRSLAVIARNRPTTDAALLRCHGIGEKKLEQYGEDVVRIVTRLLESGECTSMDD